MPDVDILNQMISASAKVPVDVHYSRRKVDLVEPAHPASNATIHGIPEDAIVIKVDAFNVAGAAFVGGRGECKRADYVVIADLGGETAIIYIEMKATKASRKDIIHQLLGAHCLITYCKEVGKAFWEEPGFLAKCKHRFVSIGHTSIPKRKTRIDRSSGRHDHPDRMLKIDWPHHLEFNHLAGA